MEAQDPMESRQRVVGRSWIFWWVSGVLVLVAVGLFVYTLVQQDLAAVAKAPDKGPVQLLDVQSATAVLIATVGAMLARAQYAAVVRPLLGFQGRVVKDLSPKADELVWAARLVNGAESGSSVRAVHYCVRLVGASLQGEGGWTTSSAVEMELMRVGLRPGVEFDLRRFGDGYPLAGQEAQLVAWFTTRAMMKIEALGVRIRVRDRLGDEHERSVDLLKGADRAPRRLQSW